MTRSQLPEITLTCGNGHPFTTRAAGGQTVRCKECGKSKHVPTDRPRTAKEAASYATPAADGHQDQDPEPTPGAELADRWQREAPWPGSVKTRPGRAQDTCPDHGPLFWEPGRTLVFCSPHSRIALPDAIGRHYERKESQRAEVATRYDSESDEDRKALHLRKRQVSRDLNRWLDDDRLTDESRDLLDFYADEVSKSRTVAQIDDLAKQFEVDKAAGKFRRQHWWQGNPTAIEPADDGDLANADDSPVVLATPASIAVQQHRTQPQRMTWAEALATCGWRTAAASIGGGVPGCPIIDEHGQQCMAPIAGSPPIVDALGRSAWLCQRHYGTLGGLIIKTNRSRGVA